MVVEEMEEVLKKRDKLIAAEKRRESGTIAEQQKAAQQAKLEKEIPDKVKDLFGGKLPINFGINHDPRGCALKLFPPVNDRGLDTGEPASPFKLRRDWGDNQLLAPDFAYERR